jgi:hypothetical protein
VKRRGIIAPMRAIASSSFVAFAFLSAVGCAPSGVKHAPVLDSLTAPSDVSLDTAKNKYPLTFTVVFHDEDSDANQVRLEIKGYPAQTLSFLDTALTQTVTIDLGAGFKGQTLSYTIQVVDATGLASNPEFRTVKCN